MNHYGYGCPFADRAAKAFYQTITDLQDEGVSNQQILLAGLGELFGLMQEEGQPSKMRRDD